MLSIFRRGAISKIMLLVLAIGIFAIVITGFGTPGSMGGPIVGGDALVTVDKESVTQAQLSDQVNRQLQRAREQQPELDVATFLEGGAFEEILRQMIGQAAMTAFAKDQHFAASKRQVDAEIMAIPAFRNLAGNFDEQAFRQALARERITEDQLRSELAQNLIQRQILSPVTAAVRVPQGVAEQYASLLLEQRTGTIGIVPAAAMGQGKEPTEAEIAAFYKENGTRYQIPERRVLRYATFSRDQIAAAAAPSDQEIAAFYNANAATYGAKETRTLSQVVLPDQAAARAFAARVAGGATFADAAKQAGFSAADTAVGAQNKAQFTELTSAAIANAAFAAAQGTITQPAQSPLGWHVVHVDAINREAARPLAAVREEIRTQLTRQKTEEGLIDKVNGIEDAIANGASLEEVAKAQNLTLQETPPITATGGRPDAPDWRAPAEVAALLEPGFQLEENEDPVVQPIGANAAGGYAVVGLSRIVPAAPPPLAAIRDRVKADLAANRAAERARAVATAIAAKINAGTPAARAFAESGERLPQVQTVNARRVDIAQPNTPVPPPLGMMFSLPQGRARILAAPNNEGWFVVHLEKAVPGNFREAPQLVQATRAQFRGILGEEYAQQFVRAVEAGRKIKRNEDAIRRAKTEIQGGTVTQ